MKRLTALLLSLLLPALALSGCGAPGARPATRSAEGKISVVCTIFPPYDWVRQILGNNPGEVAFTLLLDKKIDLHNYQPTVDDIAKISACDLFVYVGGESDEWAEDALKEAANPNMAVINLLDTLGDAAKEEEIIPGMEAEEHDDGEEGEEHDGEHEEHEYDEHVWLSLKNARVFSAAIADALSALDAGSAETYRGNLAAYTEKLAALDAEYQAAVDAAPVKTLLFGDRFPFRYLVDDYGLRYHAAFAGCSAETEASFETVIFLAEKMNELGLKTIMVTESADQKIAETIRNNTMEQNQQILALDSMQSVASADVENGATYLSIMENNLTVLKEALR